MKDIVYLLQEFDGEYFEIIGVYSSYEKANIEKIKREKKWKFLDFAIFDLKVE